MLLIEYNWWNLKQEGGGPKQNKTKKQNKKKKEKKKRKLGIELPIRSQPPSHETSLIGTWSCFFKI